MEGQLTDRRHLFIGQLFLPPPKLFEERNSEVVTLVTVRAFDVELNPLPKLLMDSMEVYHFFLERELGILILELAMEHELPSIGGNLIFAADCSSIVGLPWIVRSSPVVIICVNSVNSLVLCESLLELGLPDQLACQLKDKPVLVTLVSTLLNTILPSKEKSTAQIEDSEVPTSLVGFA